MTRLPQGTAVAFNEWLRRYTETPEEFEREFQMVMTFLEETAEGVEPSYGVSCMAYLQTLLDEMGTEVA